VVLIVGEAGIGKTRLAEALAAEAASAGAMVLPARCYETERARAVLAQLLAAVERVPWVAALAAALVVDGRALASLGERAQAQAQLDQGAALATDHGLVHVLAEARAAASRLR
jgi:KaiC/GvpD/RAD55 family RecA-like ATPase